MAETSPYTVVALGDARLSFSARRKLRRARHAGRTGLVLQGIIRTGTRSLSGNQAVVGVDEGSKELGMVSAHARSAKWASLSPGRHRLRFIATRTASSSVFERDFELKGGQILVAVCEPIQPWSPFGRSPTEDRWYIGIV